MQQSPTCCCHCQSEPVGARLQTQHSQAVQQNPEPPATEPCLWRHKTPQLLLQQELGPGQACLEQGFGVQLQVFAA